VPGGRALPDILISLADPPQREACYRLAYDIFCGEMGTMRDHADHKNGMVRDAAIEASHVFHATVDGELAGTLGVLLGGDSPFPEHFERGFDIPRFLSAVPRSRMALNIRFLVKREHRGSALPFRMILEAGRFQFGRGVQLIFCDCQPHLLNLYESLGFRPCAPVFEQPGFGVMVPLVAVVPDVAHLRRIRSPLIRYWPKDIADPQFAERIQALLPAAPPVVATAALERASWSETFGLLSQTRGRTGAFEGFSEQDIEAFLERGRILECAADQQIIVEGQGTRSAFVVLDGAAEVRRKGAVIARFEPGEMFGEFALLLHIKRTADVFACGERVRLLVLDERNLERLLSSHAELAAKFLLNLSKSLALRLLSR
jgi:predicted GNAT family N-acyltransferase